MRKVNYFLIKELILKLFMKESKVGNVQLKLVEKVLELLELVENMFKVFTKALKSILAIYVAKL